MPGQRADARRNYAQILAVAEQEVALHGAEASLEQIARVAGVGSATVRRHFPSRRELLEAVFRGRIEDLAERARELAASHDARSALLEWLDALTDYATTARGLAAALALDEATPEHVHACSTQLVGAVDPLLLEAVRAGEVRADVTTADLVALVTGIALATEHHADPAGQARRLLALAVVGISPER
ncbi:TetR/AcrR family transcriptional regulator [Umezawaea tangerina]|uniref:TetR family transcriptional regulator n=1 Tax=Umezawaea tangerina TaxID=84725 RepID=A0A2T0SGE4_9PSEU|nr:TetR/AcrR family transcriptional regulator [Umezawaea tangerina]PRY32477.1 TetR family transcriptional regulator [Umezawaea tangerina]